MFLAKYFIRVCATLWIPWKLLGLNGRFQSTWKALAFHIFVKVPWILIELFWKPSGLLFLTYISKYVLKCVLGWSGSKVWLQLIMLTFVSSFCWPNFTYLVLVFSAIVFFWTCPGITRPYMSFRFIAFIYHMDIKVAAGYTITCTFFNYLLFSSTMGAIYEEHKDEDGFLYIAYSGENTFG